MVDMISLVLYIASTQQNDLRFSGPPSVQGPDSGARTRNRRVLQIHSATDAFADGHDDRDDNKDADDDESDNDG
ncbi:hypothetical protein PoB_007190700 [Plakobranchus ocellatus]|uniref:Uncharacterized protein n=1 Tax=Plakobranchus ocellatus TaxID=259542 RepID=A0AAV4DMB1_9GAST|nr:hypothetical protein PoB_007190700 [Plakobranchus ocellatus]